jgi:NADH:ubiquinone oxidoreductase subunit 2 (subunit N)
MISLAYYLKVIAAMWMAEAPVAGSAADPGRPRWPAARRGRPRGSSETWFVALSSAPRRVFFGIVPSPLFNLASTPAQSLSATC